MRRLLRWAGAALGGVALYRLLRGRRTGAVAEVEEAPPAHGRAEELRRKLQESRALEEERAAFEEGETTVDRADPWESPEDRRRDVHERGRATADEMRSAEGFESS